MIQTLLLENYDSYSYNLFQLLWRLNGVKPLVIRNDEMDLAGIRSLSFDNIVISPGPGHPAQTNDFGICSQIFSAFPECPILGICLGHQGLALELGFAVGHAPQVRHGKISAIRHRGTGLFQGLPESFPAVRYHSLAVTAPEPHGDEVTAWSEEDGVIMGLAAPGRPHFGLQFHPESIGTPNGHLLMENFLLLSGKPAGKTYPSPLRTGDTRKLPTVPMSAAKDNEPQCLELPWRDPESVFLNFFEGSPTSFWLDSRDPLGNHKREAQEPASAIPRFSFMGRGARTFEIRGASVHTHGSQHEGDPFSFLKDYLARRRVSRTPPLSRLPFSGGLVGYLGYELREFTSPPRYRDGLKTGNPLGPPDGHFMEPDRLLAFDHAGQRVYAISIPAAKAPATGETGPEGDEDAWFTQVRETWSSLALNECSLETVLDAEASPVAAGHSDSDSPRQAPQESLGREKYQEAIKTIQAAIREGETYEVCLTQTLKLPWSGSATDLYRVLRRVNPAPYAAYYRFPGVEVLSSSPECFLKLDTHGELVSRPIKGTRRREPDGRDDARLTAELLSHGKDFSENLMIVDLVRNDFGKICEPGSVTAPAMMQVEVHPSVLQLVSEVHGKLRPEFAALDAVRTCFPGGSMTGAPKLRTMEIINGLEGAPRGVYSGALGYLGYDGAMDLSMVIRTLVLAQGEVSIGCGGAVVMESDAAEEYAEAMAKAEALLQALHLVPASQPQTVRNGSHTP